MNMALKTTIHEGRPTVLSREIMRLLSDMNEEFVRCVAGTETPTRRVVPLKLKSTR